MAFIPALPSLPARTAGRARLMASPPRPGVVASPNRRRATPAAAPAMTLAAVGRPPAAASPSDSGPPTASAATAPAPARAVDVAEVVAPITSFDEYMEMLEASSGGVAVLKFYAPWCRSCRAIAPKVARLAHEFPEIRFYEIDYEANKVRAGCRLVGDVDGEVATVRVCIAVERGSVGRLVAGWRLTQVAWDGDAHRRGGLVPSSAAYPAYLAAQGTCLRTVSDTLLFLYCQCIRLRGRVACPYLLYHYAMTHRNCAGGSV